MNTNNKDDLCNVLFEQAEKCLTTEGAGLLLSIKGHIQNQEVYGGYKELWQVADLLASKSKRSDRMNVTERFQELILTDVKQQMYDHDEFPTTVRIGGTDAAILVLAEVIQDIRLSLPTAEILTVAEAVDNLRITLIELNLARANTTVGITPAAEKVAKDIIDNAINLQDKRSHQPPETTESAGPCGPLRGTHGGP